MFAGSVLGMCDKKAQCASDFYMVIINKLEQSKKNRWVGIYLINT